MKLLKSSKGSKIDGFGSCQGRERGWLRGAHRFHTCLPDSASNRLQNGFGLKIANALLSDGFMLRRLAEKVC